MSRSRRPLRVLVAPDSFKGSADAVAVAAGIAAGWRRVRPDDSVVELPLADGGEGTLDAVLRSPATSPRTTEVLLAGGRHVARWAWLSEKNEAFVELAECCGLPLVGTTDPLGAGTEALGTVIAAALDEGAGRVVVAIGGSASTDGGAGCLRALGLRLLGVDGQDAVPGGQGLLHVARVDRSRLRPPPPGGVEILCDVTSPLFGPEGAAHVFAPQKGASAEQVALLDQALRHWHAVSAGDPGLPGAGAAGGTGYGLATYWGAVLVPGALTVAAMVGFADALAEADLVITGEGRFDRQSLAGKAPGLVLDASARAGVPAAVIAGAVAERPPTPYVALCDHAPSTEAAMADAATWLAEAGAGLALRATRGELLSEL